MTRNQLHHVSVAPQALEHAGTDPEEFASILDDLNIMLGPKFSIVFDDDFQYVQDVRRALRIHRLLKPLYGCEGYDDHILEYSEGTVEDHLFTAYVANRLEPHVDEMHLEPPVQDGSKRADVAVTIGGDEVVIECKNLRPENPDFQKQHDLWAEIFEEYIDTKHQLDVQHMEEFTEEVIQGVAEKVANMLEDVTSSGVLIENEQLRVGVQVREDPPFNPIELLIWGNSRDKEKNIILPMHIYGGGYRALSVAGPDVDFTGVLKERVDRARPQAPRDRPYLVALNGNLMLGDINENLRRLNTLFQPDRNTRISGVLLCTHNGGQAGTDEWRLIQNPYARHELPSEINIIKRKVSDLY